MQRLYSSFARGWPGTGLLCLRLVAALATSHCVVTGFTTGQPLLKTVLEGAAGAMLCAGLWTPIAGVVLSAVTCWSVFSVNGDPWSRILLAAIGAALAMLGPGAWSIDARLFGRKRLIREP